MKTNRLIEYFNKYELLLNSCLKNLVVQELKKEIIRYERKLNNQLDNIYFKMTKEELKLLDSALSSNLEQRIKIHNKLKNKLLRKYRKILKLEKKVDFVFEVVE